MDDLTKLKNLIRETDYPYFQDTELQFMLDDSGGDIKLAAYKCLVVKSEDTTIQVSGLTTGDTSKYFLRLASMYRPRNSGTLKGG